MKLAKQPLERLMTIINYDFKDVSLLELALTHKSYGKPNNERLEFLGDSVLNFAISSSIYNKFSFLSEGDLTRLRSKLVSKESLAAVAKNLDLGAYIILGSSELASGGHQRKSILADTLEALFGAVYLDANIAAASDCILKLYSHKIDTLVSNQGIAKDAKTQLQEWLQAKNYNIPEYTVIKIEGQPHSRMFYVECKILALGKTVEARATSKKIAEQNAAQMMLALLKAEE